MLRRWEWRGWDLAALAAAIAAGVAALTKAWPAPVFTSALVAAGSATMAVLISRAKTVWDRRSQQTAELDQYVLLSRHGRPPRVRELDNLVLLGVHPAAESRPGEGRVPVFVPRQMMTGLNDLVISHGFALLVGESTAGKSRAAYEAIRQLPNYQLVFPNGREGLPTAIRVILSQRRSILWLNDLDRFLGPAGIDALTVQRLLGSGRQVVIVASMRAREHSKYTTAYGLHKEETGLGPLAAGPEVLQAGREVIDLATVIRVERRWSAADLAEARKYVDDPRIADAVAHADRFGVAEYLASAPQLSNDWQDAWDQGGFPRGAALVAAAVDARRCGWLRPIPQSLLEELHVLYLDSRGGQALNPEPLGDALEWAKKSRYATSSLLFPADEKMLPAHGGKSSFWVFDYLPDVVDAAHTPIPDRTWETVISVASPTDAWDIGQAAYSRQCLSHARAAFEKAGAAGNHLAIIHVARCIGRMGKPREAADFLREQSTEQTRQFGADDPRTVRTRHELAHWTGQAGEAAEALRILRQVADDRTRILGPDDPDTLWSRHELAYWMGENGRMAEAMELYRRVIADRARVLHNDHPETLRSRHLQARWIGHAGQYAKSVERLDVLWHDEVRVHGPDHPDTLHVRHELAYWTGKAGDLAGAVSLLHEVVADRTRVLGPDHRMTLDSRHVLARWTGEGGDLAGAIAMFDEVIVDRARVLGSDHPDTLWSRHRKASWTAKAGDLAEAIEGLRVVVSDRIRILGADHRKTLDSRHHLARLISEAGRPLEASRLLEEVMADRARALGQDHPDTLASRHRHARCTGETGQPEVALQLLLDVTKIRIQVLGSDHPDTLASRHEVAYWTAMAGDAAEALRLFGSLVDDLSRVLGRDHPKTLDSRHNLARWTEEAGYPRRAIDLLTGVVADRSRVLGYDHPDTLWSRHELACCMGRAGDRASAARQLGEVVTDRARVLGPQHRLTKASSAELAVWRGGALGDKPRQWSRKSHSGENTS